MPIRGPGGTDGSHAASPVGNYSTGLVNGAYFTTLGALRDVRRAWRLAQAEAARARAGLPAIDETTLVTASSWTYLSSGYRPGEELLAAQVRHDIAHTQRLKQEGDFS
ncbi:replication initiator protein [Streptomyces phaeochromogenes]|uniref:hypothetical protein n=1 Tax=Streptomyces phaeochromogenes TaxID=1923 RepID=UPI002E2D47FF|nr:hypothetical protein [Streptomyces phaeochromogenes]